MKKKKRSREKPKKKKEEAGGVDNTEVAGSTKSENLQ